ncbi:MAG TPA: enolase C-terminal domain-like protein [Luteolibacter sp.]|nr:enolase C-terminal domain-like protein [Luteolibacter sp.]
MSDTSQPLFVSPYRLEAQGPLNALSRRRVLEGVLIETGGGYGCIQPWPELGDPPLDKCLADLRGARRWPIVRRALRCAEMDGAARAHEDSLFEELEVPLSHATLPVMDFEQVVAAQEAGFGVVKLKMGRDVERQATWLNEAVKGFPTLHWRLDFNESLQPDEARAFLKTLTDEARRALDFIEDPCPYSATVWPALFREFRVPLAVDRESSPQAHAAQVMVIKPALDEPWLLAEAGLRHQQRLVVTSNMDHPLGQAFAAWEAGRLGLEFPGTPGLCGLQTHHLFKSDAFTEMLGPWTPEFHPPPGTGLGFDDLLDELTWTPLR